MTGRTEVDFDHHSGEYAVDPAAVNDRLLAGCPVSWSPHYDGFWVVSRHVDVMAVARDDARFSSAHDTTGDGNGYGGITVPAVPFRTVPIETDPPEFHAFRRLLNPYFSPAAGERWRPFIDALTDQALDVICATGSGDVVLDLANPVPAKFTLALMGLDLDDWQTYADPAHRMVYTPTDSAEYPMAVMGCVELINALHREVLARREHPRQDFISYLLEARIDGEPLDDSTINEILFLLIFGGVDTTTGLTANALVWLAQHPDQRRLLRDEPFRMPAAIEEFLRYFTPVQTMARTVTCDTELAGQPLAAGDRLMMSFAAANRDTAQFDEPERMLLERKPNRHAAFGLGIHRCLGSNYARALTASMITGVLNRLPDYEVDHAAARRYETIGTVNGWEAVPVTFTPTPATSAELPVPPAFTARESSVAS